MTSTEAIIYLRLSDFRDEDDITFTEREAELRDLAASLHLAVRRVAIENDLNGNGGKPRGASAYKTPVKVAVNGLTTFRTRRPVFAGVLRELHDGRGLVLIVGDDSRVSRDWRDGADLIDACRVGRASVVAPDDEGEPKWILRDGGSPSEVDAFQDRINDARKYSADVAAKARKGRRRWAGKSYHGGPRPYGFRVVENTAEHHRNLVADQAEAKVIEQAAADILDKQISLRAVAAGLRERGVLTANGRQWSAQGLRGALLKPAVAGLTVSRGELVDAPWEHILERARWERLRDKLTDPSRTKTTGNAARHLLSGIATCGVPDPAGPGGVCGAAVRVTGSARSHRPSYVCSARGHLRRVAVPAEAFVTAEIVGRLSMPDAADLLKPRPRPRPDDKRLRAELAALRRQRTALMEAFEGDADALAVIRGKDRRAAEIAALLAVADEPDPLPEFRLGVPADVVWAGLGIARRRAIVRTLFASIVVGPSARRGPGFDPDTVRLTWADGAARPS